MARAPFFLFILIVLNAISANAQFTNTHTIFNVSGFPAGLWNYSRTNNTVGAGDTLMFGMASRSFVINDTVYSIHATGELYVHDAMSLSRLDSTTLIGGSNNAHVHALGIVTTETNNPYLGLYNRHTFFPEVIIFNDAITNDVEQLIAYQNVVYLFVNEFVGWQRSIMYKLDLNTNEVDKVDSIGYNIQEVFLDGNKLHCMDLGLAGASRITTINLSTDSVEASTLIGGTHLQFAVGYRATCSGDAIYFLEGSNDEMWKFDLSARTITSTNVSGREHSSTYTMHYDFENAEIYLSDFQSPYYVYRMDTAGNYLDSVAMPNFVQWISLDFDTTVSRSPEIFTRAKLYPNPAHEYAMLELETTRLAKRNVLLLNNRGIIIRKWEMNTSTSLELNFPEISAGIYFILIEEKGKIQSAGKLILVR